MKKKPICKKEDCAFYEKKASIFKHHCTILKESYEDDEECKFFKEKGTVDFDEIEKEVKKYISRKSE